MPLPPCIETGRLRLRPRRLNDIDAIVEMDLNPDVYRYRDLRAEISMAIPDETTVRNSVRSEILSGSPPDFWAVEWKDRQEFLGLAGLIAKPLGIVGLPYKSGTLFLAYRLAKGIWGQGVASEAAGAILDYGFRSLNCQEIMAFSHVENIRSRRVLEKIGMTLIGRVHPPQESAASKQPNPETSKLENLESHYVNTAGPQPTAYLCYRLDRGAYLFSTHTG
jgi:RimJ/RimL family protein N-acetyltransferase